MGACVSTAEFPEFHGRVALVTGAAQGIGAAVARELCAAGAVVAALDRSQDGLGALSDSLVGGRGGIWPLGLDVSDRPAVDRAVAQIEAELGPIAMAVNVAGILRLGAVVDLSDDDWAASLAVNATGVFNVGRAVARRMLPRQAGSIVTVGSNAAGVPRMQMAAYAASKAAATAFTLSMGLELAPHGIRCNVVSPGSTDTAMQRALWSGQTGAQAVIAGSPEQFRLGIPLGRIAEPADIAQVVVFLLSDRARHVTLHDLRVDGGATLGA